MSGLPSYNPLRSVLEWLRYHFLVRKFYSPVGAVFLGVVAISLAYLTVLVSTKLAIIAIIGLAILLWILFSMNYPFFGFYSAFFISVFTSLPEKLLNSGVIPTGLIPEYFCYLSFAAVVSRQEFRKEADHRLWNRTIMIWMLIWLSYTAFQLMNPGMMNKLGWFNYFRKQISLVAFLYTTFVLIQNRAQVKRLVNVWVWISTFEAAYTCKQEWFGLFNFENVWLMSDEKRVALFVNWNTLRKFGILSDPANAGILYAACGTFLLVLALRAGNWKKATFLYIAAILNMVATSYTGTRTGNVMIVGGLVFYGILTLYEKRTLIFLAFSVAIFAGIMFAPIYDNFAINRVRSTFEPSKDNSNLVRDINRKMVQPYVYSHPIGGGIYTSGLIGTIYNPGHYLSNFPPDSGYMQIMMEFGFIGLALSLILYFVILRTGIQGFYRVRSPELKTFYAAKLVFIFSMFVGQFSQMAIPQYPSVLYIYAAIALLLKMPYFDDPVPQNPET
jgi:putative inorganic carbon (hco3(-)) transporter